MVNSDCLVIVKGYKIAELRKSHFVSLHYVLHGTKVAYESDYSDIVLVYTTLNAAMVW